jgi:hypothetical protein
MQAEVRPMELWWGSWRGRRIGLMTDLRAPIPAEGDPAMFRYLGQVGTIQKCLPSDRLAAVTGSSADDVPSLSELPMDTFRAGLLQVDGEAAAVSITEVRGLQFALGDAKRHPFAVFRHPRDDEPWPALVSVETAP